MRVVSLASSLVAACVISWTLQACAGPEPEHADLATGDLGQFVSHVQPHLTDRCASGGCHGRHGRPLELYSPGALRLDPSRLHLDEPLTTGELEENARRIVAFAFETTAEESLLLRKPLAQAAGGCYHGGGAVFVDRTDPAHHALVEWLQTRSTRPRLGDGGAG